MYYCTSNKNRVLPLFFPRKTENKSSPNQETNVRERKRRKKKKKKNFKFLPFLSFPFYRALSGIG